MEIFDNQYFNFGLIVGFFTGSMLSAGMILKYHADRLKELRKQVVKINKR